MEFMNEYDHKEVEAKWQKHWLDTGLYKTEEDKDKPKSYVLDMFPYPSGDGLHVGHPKGYIATDVYSRYKHMNGHNVLHPMGWDAFGLPAEQYALKNKVHPSAAVSKNTERFKEQLAKIGFSYDWAREINTTDPKFYKWTQWIFKQIWKNGLAYESNEPINWCPSCKTGLSNEDLDGDACERCGTKVEKKPLRQWVIAITKYADRMLRDLDKLNWPLSIKESQRNWIGKSEGAEIEFPLSGISGQEDGKHKVKVFTTRPDTIFGVTYIAVSAELAQKWVSLGWQPSPEVADFLATLIKEEGSRALDYKEVAEKKGIATGIFATNPVNGEKIPVWIANYVLSGYGTGAIMAVPAHDERDNEFAKKYGLPIIIVVAPGGSSVITNTAYTGDGIMVNSGKFNVLPNTTARTQIVEEIGATFTSTYKLKDWVFARQRYWGEPFPIVFDETHTPHVVADSELPVLLPSVEAYEPTGTGESPLAGILDWVNVYGHLNDNGEFETLPQGDPRAKLFTRETNTMPQWAGSSWYYLRYIDPANEHALVDKEKEKMWSPVDFYVGGAEHATRHLIYARFWHKFLYDIGVVNYDEPFIRLQNVGLILASDGRKMSKRYGNVINPDDIVETFGADSLRIYEMFMGPFDQSIAWSTDNIVGGRRMIERIWKLANNLIELNANTNETEVLLHQTIKKVGEDIESFSFNTAISQMMILLNALEKLPKVPTSTYEILLKLLAPFAPHVTQELWTQIGNKSELYQEKWPAYDEAKTMFSTIKIAVQIDGKLRDTIEIKRGENPDEVKRIALLSPAVKKWLEGKEPAKIIYVEGKIVSIVR